MTDTTTEWRERGRAHPSERQLAIEQLWLKENVSLAMAERVVSHWEFSKYLLEKGKVTK